jgi:hypothetical protein
MAGIIYDRIYFFATEADFSKLINPGSLIGICMISCLVASFGYSLLLKWSATNGEIIFNSIFTIFSFGSLIIPLSVTLPLSIAFPELFPGLAIPMHFCPALGWYTLRPFFARE